MKNTRPLRIGVDARAATEVPAGRGRVVRELLRALDAREGDSHRYLLYARDRWDAGHLGENFEWRTIAARDPIWHLLAARDANRACDVFLSTNSYLTVWFLRIPAVPVVYDLVAFDRALRPRARSVLIERLTLRRAVERSSAFIAISHATADALAQRVPSAAARTSVAHLGPISAERAELTDAEADGLPGGGFVLAVGTLEPRKNLPRLVQAYAALEQPVRASHPLVVVGPTGWSAGETLEAIRGLGECVQMLGRVSDSELAELYRRCAVFCYPSLGEGFGLPVLEAMAAGAAVVTSNVSSLPEVAGAAAEYVDPLNVASIAEGMRRVLCDESRGQALREAALERAAQFSWTSFAERTLEVLEAAAARTSARPHDR